MNKFLSIVLFVVAALLISQQMADVSYGDMARMCGGIALFGIACVGLKGDFKLDEGGLFRKQGVLFPVLMSFLLFLIFCLWKLI